MKGGDQRAALWSVSHVMQTHRLMFLYCSKLCSYSHAVENKLYKQQCKLLSMHFKLSFNVWMIVTPS